MRKPARQPHGIGRCQGRLRKIGSAPAHQLRGHTPQRGPQNTPRNPAHPQIARECTLGDRTGARVWIILHGQGNGVLQGNVERFESIVLRKPFVQGAAAPTRQEAGFPREYFTQENEDNR